MNRMIRLLSLLVLTAACGDSRDDNKQAQSEADDESAAGKAAEKSSDATQAEKESGNTATESQQPAQGDRSGSMAVMRPAKPDTTHTARVEPIAENCRGFSFEGLIYSPGGDKLPNKCEPYHPTSNNPYAVRCIDAWPWFKTQYPGDHFCILPPPPDKGIQYGVHPQGQKWFEQVSKGDMSGYDNLATEWTMESGEEEQFNYQTGSTNTEPKNYYRNYARMRPGSHHMIVSSSPAGVATESWGPANMILAIGGTNLPGAQRPDENAPKSIDKPGEDDGLFSKLPANAPITFNMHHFNATDTTILKEAWTNLWWEDDARVELRGIFGLNVLQTITMNIPPGTTQDLHYSWNIQQPVRLVTVFGHRHAWTSNFSSWVESPDGALDIVYQSFAWLDEPTYRYDSETKNPEPSPDKRTDGASSGVRMLTPGQKLHFNCHIEFTDERADSEGAPKPVDVGNLRFANEAFTAEMCILFGSTAAVQLPTPDVSTSKLPDFATMD